MSPRLCSILATLSLALVVATPAFADAPHKLGSDSASVSFGAKKTKKDAKKDKSAPADADKAGKDKPAAEASGEDSSGDLDTLMSKKGKKPEPSADKGAASETEKPPADENQDMWEKPPIEQEKPIGPPPKPVEKASGDGRRWSAGLLLGWAFKTDRSAANLGADPYGLGFGIRGGYTFDFKLYTGVYYMYYIGSSESGSSARVNVPAQQHAANYMQFGAEGGYDWWVGPVIIRPSLQIGAALAITDNSASGATTSVTRLMFGPGFTVIAPIDSFFIGGEGRANLVPSSNGVSAVLLGVTAGLRFQ
jgi:hypothetical protein